MVERIIYVKRLPIVENSNGLSERKHDFDGHTLWSVLASRSRSAYDCDSKTSGGFLELEFLAGKGWMTLADEKMEYIIKVEVTGNTYISKP